MKNEQDIAQKIEETMKSLDGIQAAELNPFFFTRLQARMERDIAPSYGRFAFLANMKLNLAMLVVVLMFNVASVVFISAQNSESTESKTALEMFTEEYSSSTSSYDYLNDY
ncbi:MAG: hypothetical protein COW03_01950 [Cytophagales bacterium CG12_big_fil_rev_8_21_14_0_65_40_12]|nr:MAG: hypothetical protein COW03_01950 [Cytophagales bacterium CG12_big_fil_rev_8_21_14_0_65_40_12]PIW05910.1 MAG: hypothetical protein COW40_02055 [Cytophagales bacterium CG17_big_fil_post_rev_8_21_14_2_50_40_13]